MCCAFAQSVKHVLCKQTFTALRPKRLSCFNILTTQNCHQISCLQQVADIQGHYDFCTNDTRYLLLSLQAAPTSLDDAERMVQQLQEQEQFAALQVRPAALQVRPAGPAERSALAPQPASHAINTVSVAQQHLLTAMPQVVPCT
jgi:hypothetical protein